jgi:hypothetical protein
MNDHRRAGVVLVNPLEKALEHYCAKLRDTLELAGHQVNVLSTPEPAHRQSGRLAWIRDHVRLLRQARALSRARGARVLIVWPSLGFLDLGVIALLRMSADIIIHDPTPLSRSIGYGPLSRLLTARLIPRTELIVHSAAAEAEVRHLAPRRRVRRMPHPLVVETHVSDRTRGDTSAIRVLGQYKADRDLDLLAALGSGELGRAFKLEILGPGWPAVAGWTVESRFLAEAELDEAIRESAVVLVPYRRFYQSGIAIRCIELGVPFVAPRVESTIELVGPDSSALVPPGAGPAAWHDAIGCAIGAGRALVAERAEKLQAHAVAEWSRWALEARPLRPTGP